MQTVAKSWSVQCKAILHQPSTIRGLLGLFLLTPGTATANAVPAWFAHVSILDKTPTHFLGGTFDPLDILFTALGALVAYIVLEGTYAPGVDHET